MLTSYTMAPYTECSTASTIFRSQLRSENIRKETDLVALPGLEPGLSALRGRRVNQLHHNARRKEILCCDGLSISEFQVGFVENKRVFIGPKPQIPLLRCGMTIKKAFWPDGREVSTSSVG